LFSIHVLFIISLFTVFLFFLVCTTTASCSILKWGTKPPYRKRPDSGCSARRTLVCLPIGRWRSCTCCACSCRSDARRTRGSLFSARWAAGRSARTRDGWPWRWWRKKKKLKVGRRRRTTTAGTAQARVSLCLPPPLVVRNTTAASPRHALSDTLCNHPEIIGILITNNNNLQTEFFQAKSTKTAKMSKSCNIRLMSEFTFGLLG